MSTDDTTTTSPVFRAPVAPMATTSAATTTAPAPRRRSTALSKARQRLRGVLREDSDDELGDEDLPWEWIYGPPASDSTTPEIIGAQTGDFDVRVGDCILIKGEGLQGEAYVGMAVEFADDADGDKTANVMWFSTQAEIPDTKKTKRTDALPNELYLNPSYDCVPLPSINGRAKIFSPQKFAEQYPNGVPRKSAEFGKVFVCRRGCNPRTATYTDEFVWEDVWHGRDTDIFELGKWLKKATTARREKKPAAAVRASPRKRRLPRVDEEGEYKSPDEEEEDDEGEEAPRTPSRKRARTASSTPGTRRTPRRSAPTTPRRITVKKPLLFTPLSTRLLSPQTHLTTPHALARHHLHVATLPCTLPCRDPEFAAVYTHLADAITSATGACIYISGTPGTGKTATVREVVAQLQLRVLRDDLDDFTFVEINGLKIAEPAQAYALLWEALRGERVSPAQALALLDAEFSRPSPRRVPCVVLMDELDQLVTRGQGVMYNFFNWPGARHSRLIVLAVANTMDLPERTLSNKISSRLGLTRITFPGYTHQQLQAIIASRLAGVAGDIVDADAVQFAARKVAAVSGDARRALDICRRAVELAELAGAGRVTIPVVKRAIAESTTAPLQVFLRRLPLAGKVFLAAVLARGRRSGRAESLMSEVLEEAERLGAVAGEGVAEVLEGGARRAGLGEAVVGLVEAGVVGVEGRRGARGARVRVLVGEEEVRAALRGDAEVGAMVGG